MAPIPLALPKCVRLTQSAVSPRTPSSFVWPLEFIFLYFYAKTAETQKVLVLILQKFQFIPNTPQPLWFLGLSLKHSNLDLRLKT